MISALEDMFMSQVDLIIVKFNYRQIASETMTYENLFLNRGRFCSASECFVEWTWINFLKKRFSSEKPKTFHHQKKISFENVWIKFTQLACEDWHSEADEAVPNYGVGSVGGREKW